MAEQVTTDLPEQITSALADLGDSALVVADQMRARGIKGHRMVDSACPIARFITDLPGVNDAEVAGDDGTFTITMPKPVTEFVAEFDRGIHLDLVELPAVAR